MEAKDLKILYEDNHLIAVYKPAGILVQGDKTGDVSLMDVVRAFLKTKYKKSGNVFLGLIHRLDRPVSGVVLFAKTSKGASRISEQIRDREFRKTYYGLVGGKMDKSKDRLRNMLAKDESRGMALESKDGEEAILDYEIIRSGESASLAKINLITGRFHQIRAQFSFSGHPIVGDIKYGSKQRLGRGTIGLCATEIEFKAATGDDIINVKIGYPKEWGKYIK